MTTDKLQCVLNANTPVVTNMQSRDMTKFAFEFDNVWTSNVFSRFEIRRFSRTCRRIRTSGLHDRHHLPNSLKKTKIILDRADRHVSKDGPFRILGNALTYLLSDFFGISFLHFYHRHSHSHLNGFVLWNSHLTNANFSWLRHIPNEKFAHTGTILTGWRSLSTSNTDCVSMPTNDYMTWHHSTRLVSACMLYYCNTVGWAWWDWGLIWWLTILLQCFDNVGWVTWHDDLY